MRAVIATAAAIGISLFAAAAVAQEPASTFSKGVTFVISAERLVGLSFTNDKEENSTGTSEDKRTTTEFGLPIKVFSPNPYFVPQLGFDVFVIDHLSVGAAMTYWNGGGEVEERPPPQPPEPATRQLPDSSLFKFTPRVGFGMMFNDFVGIWARGGVTYYKWAFEQENGDETSEDGWAVNVEGMLVLSPINHIGIGLGPVFDIGLTGEEEDNPSDPGEPTTTADVKRNQYGAMAGLFVWF